jgi:hypothetical protein
MNDPFVRAKIYAHALVIRTKPNYYKMIVEKMADLPWGEQGARAWLDLPNDRLAGRTPRDLIESGEGHIAEAVEEDLVALHFAFATLCEVQERYGNVPELQEVWNAFIRAQDSWPWKPR